MKIMKENKPQKQDIIPVAIYFLCLLTLLFGFYFPLIEQKILNVLILGMNIFIPFFLFLFYFKRLRIEGIYLSWIGIGLIHAISTYPLAHSIEFKAVNGHYAAAYLIIIITLATLFLLRIVSAFLFGQEFIATAYFSPKDRRKKKPIDYIITFLGMFLIAIYYAFSSYFLVS
jgi:hypothetical protein